MTSFVARLGSVEVDYRDRRALGPIDLELAQGKQLDLELLKLLLLLQQLRH